MGSFCLVTVQGQTKIKRLDHRTKGNREARNTQKFRDQNPTTFDRNRCPKRRSGEGILSKNSSPRGKLFFIILDFREILARKIRTRQPKDRRFDRTIDPITGRLHQFVHPNPINERPRHN